MNEDFTGGPPEDFDRVGREQLVALLEHGLLPTSTVADIGCGALRGGCWVIPLLEPGNYCGVEPNRSMVEAGLKNLDPEVVRLKRPRFSYNAEFDLSDFDTRFSHVLMRSIWTHASKRQIEASLDSIVTWGAEDVVVLTSVIKPSRSPFSGRADYKGDSWVGRSHESDQPGMVAHSYGWIRKACEARELRVERWNRPPLNGQYWLRVTRMQRSV